MKRLNVIILSILVLSGGVAHALEACLRHAGHSDHENSWHPSGSKAVAGHDDPQEPAAPVIHCALLTQEFVSAGRMTSEISRPGRAFAALSFPDFLSAAIKNDRWSDSVFRRIGAMALAIKPARHIVLSVFQI